MSETPKRWFDRIRGRAPAEAAAPAVRVRVSVESFDPAAQSLADLEQGLLFVPALAPPRVGTVVTLEVEVEPTAARRVEALVVWAKPPRAGSAGGFGARVHAPAPEFLEALADVARRWRAQSPKPAELTALALGLRERGRDTSPPIAATANIRSDPTRPSKPPPTKPAFLPLKPRAPEPPGPRPLGRLTIKGDDIADAAAALARQLEAELPTPLAPPPSTVRRRREDETFEIIVDDSTDDAHETEVAIPPSPVLAPLPLDLLLEQTDIALGDEPEMERESPIVLPDEGDDTVETDTSLRETADVEVAADEEKISNPVTPEPPAPLPAVVPPRERVSFGFDDEDGSVATEATDDAVRATLPRALPRIAVNEHAASDVDLAAPPEEHEEEASEEAPPHDPAADELQFPNEYDLALHAELDVLFAAPTTPPPTRSARAIALVQPPDGSLRVEVRFATPALYVAYFARYLADGVVYVPTTLPPRPGTALQVRMVLPDGAVVTARALVVVKPAGAPRTGCVARLVDPDDRLVERLGLLAKALARP